MKIKHKAEDFRVRELLNEGFLRPSGRYRIYRVTKRKLTTLEAARELGDALGVPVAQVGLAGLKDRQGVTIQYMSVQSRRSVNLRTRDLTVEPVGYSSVPVSSQASAGNAFTITVRRIGRMELDGLQQALEHLTAHGLPNYFGDQRFGNLRHGQGWIASDLSHGEHERALRALLCRSSEHDNAHHRSFKSALDARWGDWRACRDIAGKFGAHHSIFEHLHRHAGDFAGAFEFVASRLRLIHLYAWQSHIWNRAVARYVEEITPAADLLALPQPEGRLFFARGPIEVDPSMTNRFRLPGPRLEDVSHPTQRRLLTEVLAREGLRPEQFDIQGVSGFQLKGEDRELIVHPRSLRADDATQDHRKSGDWRVKVSFELPRGAYANLVIARLFLSADTATRRRPDARADAPRKAAHGRRAPRTGPPANGAPADEVPTRKKPHARAGGHRAPHGNKRPAARPAAPKKAVRKKDRDR